MKLIRVLLILLLFYASEGLMAQTKEELKTQKKDIEKEILYTF